MKLRLLAAAAALCLAVFASSALAAGGLTGTLTTKIASGHYQGEWKLTFKGGKFKVANDGHTLDGGTYSSTATTLTFNDDEKECPGPAKYTWKLKTDTVTFKKINDPCADRAAVLTHPFTLSK